MPAVTDAEIKAYEGMVTRHAQRYARLPGMQNMAEDFAQEGRIAVWNAIKDGFPPSNVVVENAMKMAARTERRKGLSGFEPLDDEIPALR